MYTIKPFDFCVLGCFLLTLFSDSFGKAFLFSLGAGGQQGVEKLLKNMREEIRRNMILMGCKNVNELNSSKLIYRK